MSDNPIRKDPNFDEIEIHTMKGDLSDVGKEVPLNQDLPSQKNFSNTIPEKENKPTPLSFTESQNEKPESPFFNQKDWKKTQTQAQAEMGIEKETEKKEIFKMEKNDFSEKKGSATGRIVFFAIIISIILIAGIGVYYFWMTRGDQSPNEVLEESPFEEKIKESEADFFSDKPNYLIIKNGEAEAKVDLLKAGLQDASTRILLSGMEAPLEFILTDENNFPLSFGDFLQMADSELPVEIINNLETEFSLFFLNENGRMKTVLAVWVRNNLKLKENLLKEEKKLVHYLNVLYLDYPVTAQEVKFSDSKYMEQGIRYYNLSLEDKFSLDYTLMGEKVYFATSEKALKTVMGLVSNESSQDDFLDSQNAQDIPNIQEEFLPDEE